MVPACPGLPPSSYKVHHVVSHRLLLVGKSKNNRSQDRCSSLLKTMLAALSLWSHGLMLCRPAGRWVASYQSLWCIEMTFLRCSSTVFTHQSTMPADQHLLHELRLEVNGPGHCAHTSPSRGRRSSKPSNQFNPCVSKEKRINKTAHMLLKT
jgi:hypothetical protein